MNAAGANAFTLSPMKWVMATNALGMFVKAGRGGGTFAHKDSQKIHWNSAANVIKYPV
jgi:hypothetical protein